MIPGNNYPNRNIQPTNRYSRTIPEDGAGSRTGMGSLTQGMQQGDGYRRTIDPVGIMQQIAGAGAAAGNAGGWDWDKANRKHLNYDVADQILGNNAEDGYAAEIKAEAMGIASRISAKFVHDTRLNNSAGLYRWFLDGVNGFSVIPNAPHIKCPIRGAFLEFVKATPALKNLIAQRASIVGGYNFSIRLAAETNPGAREVESLYVTAVINVLFMEMMNWFGKTDTGRQSYSRMTQELHALIARLPNFIEIMGECFAYFDIENPYASLTPVPQERIDPEANASQYVTRSYAGTKNDFFGYQGDPGALQQPGVRDELMEMIHRNAGESQYQPTNTPQWDNPFPSADITYGRTTNDRTDYCNLTKENMAEFNLNIFYPIPGMESWYVVDDSAWFYVQTVFRRHADQATEFCLLEDCYRIVKINWELDDGWFSDVVKVKGLDMKRVLTDPSLLLPTLEADEKGDVVITQTSLPEASGEEDDLLPLMPVKELENIPGIVLNNEVVESQQLKEVETVTDGLYDIVKPDTTEMFGMTTPVRNWTPFITEHPDVVTELYMYMHPLIKGSSHKPKDFFSFVSYVERVLDDRFGVIELKDLIEEHITETLNRWLVECRGYGPTMKDPYHYKCGPVFARIDEFKEFLQRYDTSTLDSLMDPSKFTRLFNRCKMFASSDDRKRLLESITPEGKLGMAARVTNERTLVIIKDIVFTRLGNIRPPIPEHPTDTVKVKRSIFPEIFSIVEQGFGKACEHLQEGAEQIFSFEYDDSLWLFITSDFDKNVGVLRRIYREGQLISLKF